MILVICLCTTHFFTYEAEAHVVVQVGLELAVYLRLVSNLGIHAYPNLLNIGSHESLHLAQLTAICKPSWLFPDLLNTAFEFISYEEKTGYFGVWFPK